MGIRNWMNSRSPSWVKFGFGTMYIHTEKGKDTLDDIASYRSAWKIWHSIGIVLLLTVMIGGAALMLFAALATLQASPEPTAANQPSNALLIPGVSDFIPVASTVYVLAALVSAMIIHEFGHAVAARADGLPVEEYGLIFVGPILMGAYVKADEAIQSGDFWPSMRVLSAGILNNALLFVIASVLFLLPNTGSLVDAYIAYFGGLSSGSLPTNATVASLSPLTNLLFWVWFININLVIINALPITGLDGGHALSAIMEQVFDRLPVEDGVAKKVTVATVSLVMVGVVLFAMFGVHFI